MTMPNIHTAAPAGPTRFNVGAGLSAETIARIKAYMWREFQIDWKAPSKVIEIESSEEAARIMQQRPRGYQACPGKGVR